MKVTNIKVNYTPMEPPNPPMVDVTFDIEDEELGVIRTVTLTGVNLIVGTPASEQIKRLIWNRAVAEYNAWQEERRRLEAAKVAAQEIVEALSGVSELTEEDFATESTAESEEQATEESGETPEPAPE